MTAPEPRHTLVRGGRRADRQRLLATLLDGVDPVVVCCHRRLRGPYTGVDDLLRAVLPDALERHPDLVEAHRGEILYGMPELAALVGAPPPTLADEAPFDQRTRFYGAQMVRCMSQGIVTFLVAHVRDSAPLCVVFEDAHAAEPTTLEFIALLARRCPPSLIRVVVSAASELDSDLTALLPEAVVCQETPPVPDARTPQDLVRAYVNSDGTTDDAAELAAYQAADPAVVRRLHDERADTLEPNAGQGTVIGALSFHREHGTSPSEAGREALDRAFRVCVETGFSAAVVDLGARGRAVTDPDAHPKQYLRFAQHAASALVALGRHEEALTLYLDLRARFLDPKVHMIASYSIAMLYTRFFQPRDHETAIGWQNNAHALASQLPDPAERRTYEVFQANGLALVEMHRGNLDRALRLVEDGMARLDEELGTDDWVLHRSQLLYNRTRLLAAMGRVEEATEGFTRLIELDPRYTDYLSERARLHRRRGDIDAALADYDRAVRLGPPFPELYYNRGTARLHTGDVDGAMADFDHVLEMEPDDLDTRLSRAELALALGDPDAADADAVAGLRTHPDEPRLRALRGTVALERDQHEEALAHLDAALAVDPRFPAALVNRAVAHFRANRPAAAAQDLTRALDIVGDDPDVLLNRGIALAAHGDRTAAIDDFDRALTLPDADIPELLYQRGLCHLDARHHERASEDLRECLRLGEHEEEITALLSRAIGT